MSVQLPIYEMSTFSADEGVLQRIAADVFGAGRVETERFDDRVTARAGSLEFELDLASGGIRAADTEQLWKLTEKPSLVSSDDAYKTADELLAGREVFPRFDAADPFVVTRTGPGRTMVALDTGSGRSKLQLDVQARYGVSVRNPGVDGEPDVLPVVGGGGKFSLTLGDGGRPIAYHGLWRPVREAKVVDALDVGQAREQYLKLMDGIEIVDVTSFLAYHAAPFGSEQRWLTPVWVFSSRINVGKRTIPARLVTIPATDFGPHPPKPEPQPIRESEPGRSPSGEAKRIAARPTARANPSEAGTSWIGLSGGLPGSQANAKGFVDGLAADGWNVNFNWGDSNAWESDWRRNDDTWVDAVDFVFYTGHANQDGWVLAAPDDGALTFNEVGNSPGAPGDLWGRQDLEWAIIAACGPLQDDLLAAGGGNVLARWDGAFDGLHTLMGYGAITSDNTEEGGRVVKYARRGTPLIDAWFRTAHEIQPSTNGAVAPDGPDVWVGAMWVTKPGVDPRSDHLWGHGSVSGDPTSPTGLACMWTTC